MKAWVGYGLLAISLVVAYQAFQNSRSTPETEAQAKGVACDIDPDCMVKQRYPSEVRTDIVRRRYQWRTTQGPVTVECNRTMYLLGRWECTPTRGAMSTL